MKQATIAAIFSIPVLAFFAYLLLRDDSENSIMAIGGTKQDVTQSPLIIPIPKPTVSAPATLYSTEEGEGLEAIKFTIKNIMSDNSLLRRIKTAAKLNGYFSGVSNGFFKKELFKNTGAVDELDIPLYPSFIDRSQKDTFERIISFDFSRAMKDDGRASASNKLIHLMKVDSTFGNYEIANDRNSISEDVVLKRKGAGGYGNPLANKGRDENWGKFYNDCVKLSENHLSNISKFDRAIVDQAVEQLSIQGWRFVGYHPPS